MPKRRFPRLCLTTEQFKLSDNGKVFAVTDLSTGGMGIRVLDREDLAIFPVLREIKGTLKIRDGKFPIKARVCNVRKDSVGCEFINVSKKTSAAVKEFLDPLRLGPDLKPVPLEEEGASWFHGTTGTDVLVWKSPSGDISRFGVYIFGTYVQWEPGEGLTSGRIVGAADEETVPSGIIRLETMILDPDPSPDEGKVGIAKTLILSSNLAQELQNFLSLKMAGEKHGT